MITQRKPLPDMWPMVRHNGCLQGVGVGWLRDRLRDGLSADDLDLLAKSARRMGVEVQDLIDAATGPSVRLQHIGSRRDAEGGAKRQRGHHVPIYRIVVGDAEALIAWLGRHGFTRFEHASPLTLMRTTIHGQVAVVGVADAEISVVGSARAVVEVASLLDQLTEGGAQ